MNNSKGKKWYNNGKIDKMFLQGTQPEGWYLGRLAKRNKSLLNTISREKIDKIIRISIKSNRNRGGVVLKNKIINDLINNGYSYDVITKVISNYEFDNDSIIAKREYDKLYKRLSRKYSGKELEYKIKEKLYQKGLSYED